MTESKQRYKPLTWFIAITAAALVTVTVLILLRLAGEGPIPVEVSVNDNPVPTAEIPAADTELKSDTGWKELDDEANRLYKEYMESLSREAPTP